MNHPHNQDREWALVQRIRELRQSDPRGAELKTLQAELVAVFESDVQETASKIRSSFRLFQADRPDRDGIIENHLRLWIIGRAVPKYDPQKNDSFAKYVFTGWRTRASIQEYLREFKLPTRRIKDDDGGIVKEIIRILSLDVPAGAEEEGDDSFGDHVEQDHRIPRDENAGHETVDLLDALHAVAKEASLPPEEVLHLLEPLAYAECEPGETDEHRRREAMLVLLRSDLSCPDCSDEFQRRQWWNSLADSSEQTGH